MRRVKFLFDSPVDWTLDGEYAAGSEEVNITNLHNAIELIVPQ